MFKSFPYKNRYDKWRGWQRKCQSLSLSVAIIENYPNRHQGFLKFFPNAKVFKAYENELPNFNFNLYIFSGGKPGVYEEEKYPYLKIVKNFLKKLITLKKPILGVCLGHQLIVDVCGGEVKKTKLEAGLIKLNVRNHEIFDGLNPYFFAFHNDEVISLPEKFKLIASSKNCKVHAIIHKYAPIIGVQFHPEFTKDIWDWVIDITKKEELRKESKNYDIKNSRIFFENIKRWANGYL